MQIKYQIEDCHQMEQTLVSVGYKLISESIEEDNYYLVKIDQKMRLRHDTQNEKHFLMQEGKQPAAKQTPSGDDLEVGEEKASSLSKFYEQAGGFKCSVKKKRKVFVHEDLSSQTVSVDSVVGLGCFAEIEMMDADASMEAMKETGVSIGLREEAIIDKNYPDMVLGL